MKKLGALLVLSVTLPLCAMEKGSSDDTKSRLPNTKERDRQQGIRQGEGVAQICEQTKEEARNQNTATNLKNWHAMKFFGISPKQAIGVGLVLTATASSFKHIKTRHAQGKKTYFELAWLKSRKFVRRFRNRVLRTK